MKKYFNIITVMGIIAEFISITLTILTVTGITKGLIKDWGTLCAYPLVVIVLGIVLGSFVRK